MQSRTKKSIEIWGDGEQTRSFMYIDDCIDGTIKLMESNINYPLNIGSSEMVSINQLQLISLNTFQIIRYTDHII